MREKLTATAGDVERPADARLLPVARCDADGLTCVDIPDATASTYVATVADTGKTLVVQVNVASPGRTASRRERPDRRGRAAADPVDRPCP